MSANAALRKPQSLGAAALHRRRNGEGFAIFRHGPARNRDPEAAQRHHDLVVGQDVGRIFPLNHRFDRLADRFGRRLIFAFMCAGSLVMLPITYLVPSSYGGVLMLLPILGFFNNGIFSGFPIYLPELYPTALRATVAC